MSNSELVTLLDEIEAYLGRFVIMGDRERAVVALWTFHTWAFEAADTTPYLDVSSPVKQCGKTRLFEVLELLVRRPQFGANHTEVTLFRVIDQKEPTLLLDEIDRTFGKDPKLYAGIMAVLNTGYRHGATIPRNVGEGSNMKVKDFKTFSPKAFAGIGSLPDTLADRSIPIRLERRAPSQIVERFRERREYQRTEGCASGWRNWPRRASTFSTRPNRASRMRYRIVNRMSGSRCWRSRTSPAPTGRVERARRRSAFTPSGPTRTPASISSRPPGRSSTGGIRPVDGLHPRSRRRRGRTMGDLVGPRSCRCRREP